MRAGIRKKLAMDHNDEQPSIAAERLLKKLGPDLNRSEEESFITAFMVYAVSILIDSKGTGSSECDNYWPALKDVYLIKDFNWAELLIGDVMNMCRISKLSVKKRITTTPPAGCLLLLLVQTFTILYYNF